MFKDYYKILGISSSATADEVKKAYRNQSMRWHPDRNPGKDTTSVMQDINEAYNILKDPDTRARYDAEYAAYMSAKYSQANTVTTEADYEVKDETLKQDMGRARKDAEDYVREFFASLKEDAGKARSGAWQAIKPYLVAFLVLQVIGLILLVCSRSCEGEGKQKALAELAEPPVPTTLKAFIPTAKDGNWQKNEFFNAFSVFTPPIMELRKKDSPYAQHLDSIGMASFDSVVVFCQKGLPDMVPVAFQAYSRIMLFYSKDSQGACLNRDETVEVTPNDAEIIETVDYQIGEAAHLMGQISTEWIRVNGANGLQISYRRSGADHDESIPVVCRIVIFHDDNQAVMMMLSYREKESGIWKDDFDKVLRSFRWKN